MYLLYSLKTNITIVKLVLNLKPEMCNKVVKGIKTSLISLITLIETHNFPSSRNNISNSNF